MKSKRKIGVVIPAVVDSLESELLSEIYNCASRLGYDIIVFTNSSNSLDSFLENDYIHGEEKIYELQQKKAELIDNMLDTKTSFINKLSKEDIMKLFE